MFILYEFGAILQTYCSELVRLRFCDFLNVDAYLSQ